MSAILELLLRLAYVLLAALGLRAFERQWEAGLRRDAELDELLAIAEERRLLYVGVTRARQRVELSWAAARSPGAKPSRKPSRFLGPVRKGTVPRS